MMRKTLLAIVLTSLTFIATAQQQGFVSGEKQAGIQGGFDGPSPDLSTVAEAKTQRDDTWVVLEGNIVRQTGKMLYEFRDSTGIVTVDIDDKRWMGQRVSPQDKVRIEGEVDKERSGVEIDVKTIRLLK